MLLTTPFHLTNKTILITGASSGIGRQCAINCSRMGAHVILLGRRPEALEETANQLAGDRKFIIIAVDLTDYDEVGGKIKEAVQVVGKLDGVIHSAGISTTLPLRMVKPEKLDHYFQTNVTAAIELTRLVTKPVFLSTEGASIIFLSSVMGMVGETGKSIYSLTKGALIAGSKSLALELARKKVRVNCISPGVVETPMSNQAVYTQNEQARQRIQALHPLGLGNVEDIANACIFLLSDAARWVTGTNLVVDGGYTAQ
ncbi:SDR family NAD(P)-dependent oxidoreductase [Flavilitoribacter nigricans]|uniref:Short-chain dehydrogenase n=1 Tax=Flavilitoribacter nigricans (strain ATCC 23147 / DSM 23189 / NBRC 102662 / NCIMB 1420 / SS-2) TaxID=1122177 RepID=A0A2D0MYY1_FLAN2|nr:SDR family oxidoreductase [Flavilitoribacter nigricans]PHN01481.1 short-chain dehydrogenase [Flavilitoribacter nigricans DSM 23189 = NBRC 102662]